jgi:RNA polymerase sigma-70 factor (ECF subfamily)
MTGRSNTVEPSNRLTVIEGLPVGEVLAGIRVGDQTALASLYRAMYALLWRIALLMTRSAATAEEVVQDVFLALWARREVLDVEVDIQVYLAAAVRNRANDIGRHGMVVSTVERAVEQHTLDAPAVGMAAPAPDVAVETQEFYDAYYRALALLTKRERTALLLRWEQELTFEQIGGVLGLSNVGARAVVLRGQQKIQQALADYRT